MVVIIDYGMGNVTSVLIALKKIGANAEVTNDRDKIYRAAKLILPGVGAFNDGITNIKKRNLNNILKNVVFDNKKPILGICLGMQLMCTRSYEFGEFEGLGWVNANVKPLDEKINLCVPHMGWNDISIVGKSTLTAELPVNDFYFVHSYYVDCENKDNVIAICNYGIDFCCAFQKENIYGVQFHPEKSQGAGLALLNNFVKL